MLDGHQHLPRAQQSASCHAQQRSCTRHSLPHPAAALCRSCTLPCPATMFYQPHSLPCPAAVVCRSCTRACPAKCSTSHTAAQQLSCVGHRTIACRTSLLAQREMVAGPRPAMRVQEASRDMPPRPQTMLNHSQPRDLLCRPQRRDMSHGDAKAFACCVRFRLRPSCSVPKNAIHFCPTDHDRPHIARGKPASVSSVSLTAV
mmetsp:Transcript_794/g.2142  ORF Transcript_794/g.2142 Transcript_794/m.2142 type:complete len:202 (-) Transcript_794:135-740(-)